MMVATRLSSPKSWHEVPGDRNERGTVPVGYRMTDPAGWRFGVQERVI
jgi:hypothetical protein